MKVEGDPRLGSSRYRDDAGGVDRSDSSGSESGFEEHLDAGLRRIGIAGEEESEAGEAVAPTSERHPGRGWQDLEIDVGAE